MGGFASSEFPELAYLGVRVFMYPLVGAMWYNNRSSTGWAVVCAYSYFFWLITIAFDLHDPVQAILERTILMGLSAFREATIIYFGVFVIIILLASWLGQLICMLMDIRELLPFDALFPVYQTHNIDGIINTKCNPIDVAALRAYYCMCMRGLEHWCFTFIDPPYWHTFITFILSLIILTLPDYIFWYFVPTMKVMAYFVALALRVVGYIAAWFYWSYYTDLYVWGPTEYNTKVRRESRKKNPDYSPYARDPDIEAFEDALFAETQSTINKNVLVIALIDIFGFLLIGAVIIIPATPDVDVVIGVGIAYLVFILLILTAIAIFYYVSHGADQLCPDRCHTTGLPLYNSKISNVVPLSNTQQQPKEPKIYSNKNPNLKQPFNSMRSQINTMIPISDLS